MSAESSRRASARLRAKPTQDFKHLLNDGDVDEEDKSQDIEDSDIRTRNDAATLDEESDTWTTPAYIPRTFRIKQTARRAIGKARGGGFGRLRSTRSLEPKTRPSGEESDSFHGSSGDEEFPVPNHGSKRMKISRNSQKGKGKAAVSGKRRGGKLSLLPNMPLDILFSVFSFLPPKALLALTRVNHLFRDTLLSKNSVSIWINMRKYYNVPEPLDLSEPQWARLLFDSSHCQVCGVSGATIDFILQRRICRGCIRHNGVPMGKFKSEFPFADPSVLQYVIPSPGYGGHNPRMYYNRSDLQAIISDLSWRHGSAREIYIKKRLAYNKKLQDHATECERWLSKHAERTEHEAEAAIAARFEAVKKHLFDMGYSDRDAQVVKHIRAVAKDTPLTKQSWASIKSTVLAEIRQDRMRRLLSDDTGILADRRRLVRRMLIEYKRVLTPKEWRHLPHVDTVCLLPAFRSLLVVPDGDSVTEATLKVAFESLATEVNAWTQPVEDIVAEDIDKHNDLLLLYKSHGTGLYHDDMDKVRPLFNMSEEEFEKLRPLSGRDSLELAMTVVECTQCRASWPTFSSGVRHACHSWYRHESDGERAPLELARRMDRVVMSLISQSGFDILTATADEMDDRGAFYKCLNTEVHDRDRPEANQEFIATWRELISHERKARGYIPRYYYNPKTPQRYQILDDDASRTDERICWTCSHCNAHVEDLVTRAEVIEHIKSEHGITEPHVPDDFLCAGC
ncbi:hypothetical protein Moror_5212 [Moniliophthora roreri MCA 2997]|uniref:F-box domain-containing protein n=2 Tax=Moniliophthora roreri TaxID=221103 RepID=V2X9S6_MONRO|nr:hypothetical protein Moror_5212 [Moniliophthora roreri MCA 2997]